MLRVKVFEGADAEKLESEINRWLNEKEAQLRPSGLLFTGEWQFWADDSILYASVLYNSSD